MFRRPGSQTTSVSRKTAMPKTHAWRGINLITPATTASPQRYECVDRSITDWPGRSGSHLQPQLGAAFVRHRKNQLGCWTKRSKRRQPKFYITSLESITATGKMVGHSTLSCSSMHGAARKYLTKRARGLN